MHLSAFHVTKVLQCTENNRRVLLHYVARTMDEQKRYGFYNGEKCTSNEYRPDQSSTSRAEEYRKKNLDALISEDGQIPLPQVTGIGGISHGIGSNHRK